MKVGQITTKCHLAFTSAVVGCLLLFLVSPATAAAAMRGTDQMVFSMDRDLFTIDQTGYVRLTIRYSADLPQYSPDGRNIAFFDSDYGIFLIRSCGGTPVPVIENRGSGSPSWSPTVLS